MENNINIEEVLEKIVFDKDNLVELKKALIIAKSGELSITDLGKKILELRSRIFEALKRFIPFHLKLTTNHNSLEQFSKKSFNTVQLERELEEKNQLLETIELRINQLIENLNPSSESD